MTAGYDFTRVARGSISLSMVGSAVRRIFDEVRPQGNRGDVPAEMWVSRRALDEIASRIHQRIVQSGRNAGLSPESWKALQAAADKSLTGYFASLHPEDLAGVIGRDADLWIVYTADSGKLEARPVMVDDKVTLKERSEEYHKKGANFLKAVQDVFKKGSYSRESHHELTEWLKLNGDVGVNVPPFFSGSTKLGLDKPSTEITDEDIRQANESRDYFLNDSARRDELKTRITEKTQGEMKMYATKTKTLDLYRLDSSRDCPYRGHGRQHDRSSRR